MAKSKVEELRDLTKRLEIAKEKFFTYYGISSDFEFLNVLEERFTNFDDEKFTFQDKTKEELDDYDKPMYDVYMEIENIKEEIFYLNLGGVTLPEDNGEIKLQPSLAGRAIDRMPESVLFDEELCNPERLAKLGITMKEDAEKPKMGTVIPFKRKEE